MESSFSVKLAAESSPARVLTNRPMASKKSVVGSPRCLNTPSAWPWVSSSTLCSDRLRAAISVPGLEVVIQYRINDSRISHCNVADDVRDSPGLRIEERLNMGADGHVITWHLLYQN